jgi:glycosyltransferase involved in cell wall biosynthesis
MIKEAIVPNFDLKGVRFMFFPTSWVNQGGDLDKVGGKEFLKRVVATDKKWPGIPNIYNRMDVLLRIDCSYGYSFPTLEAAACGVPVIVTNQGIDEEIVRAGGGLMLMGDQGADKLTTKGDDLSKAVREAVIWMRDHPNERKQMGGYARSEIINNWTWDKHIDNWRQFFKEGIKNSYRYS